MTSQQVIQFEYRQALAYDSDRPGWSENLDISVRLTSAALTSGWLREHFGGRGNDFMVLLAIVMHARPLDGDDLNLLIRMGMAAPGDRGRLYARVTGMALAEELGMSRNTVRTCARQLVELNLVAEQEIPEGIAFRDSHGKFDGDKVYLLSGVVQNWLAKDIQGHSDGAQPASLVSTGVDGAQKPGTAVQNGAQNLNSAQELCAVENRHAQKLCTDTRSLSGDNPTTARKNCAEGVQDLITNKSQVNVVVIDPERDSTTTDSDSGIQTQERVAVKTELLAANVYAQTADDLLQRFDPDLIQEWLTLYDTARAAGLASGPGWLVDALQKGWEIDKIRQQLALPPAPIPEVNPLPEKLLDDLPERLRDDVAEIGWCGPLDELARYYASDPEWFENWLAHIRSHRYEYSRPAGILLNNLRAGLKAPKPPHDRFAYLHEQAADWEDDDPDGDEPEGTAPDVILPEAASKAWQAALGQLRAELSPQYFQTWVQDARPLHYDEGEGVFEIGVLNAYARDWLESRVSATLSTMLSGMLKRPVQAKFVTIGT